jgi:predicted ATPase
MRTRARQRSGALAGRADELAEIERGLDRVAFGEAWFVQLIGEPGIGKTRLLAELCVRAERRDWLVLDGRAAEFERDVPFGVVVDALNGYLGGLDPALLRSLEDDALAELASVFPSLSRYAEEPAARGVDSERYRTQYAIRSLLERLVRRQPVALMLDDVHWADAASLDGIVRGHRRAARESPPAGISHPRSTTRRSRSPRHLLPGVIDRLFLPAVCLFAE